METVNHEQVNLNMKKNLSLVRDLHVHPDNPDMLTKKEDMLIVVEFDDLKRRFTSRSYKL